MKRARTATRGESLTGGTGDVSPQLLTASVTLTAANTYTEATIPIPIARFQLRKGKSIIAEILDVAFFHGAKDNNPAAAGEISVSSAQLSTISLASLQLGDPHVFCASQLEYRGAFTAAGSYFAVHTDPIVVPLDDGAGHGYLVATDNIYLSYVTSNYTAAATLNAKIKYRFKMVDLEEYIGIVQGQQ